MSKLTDHIKKVNNIIDQAVDLGVNPNLLKMHVDLLNKKIKTIECLHDPMKVDWQTHKSAGRLWICSKCNKVIEIETLN